MAGLAEGSSRESVLSLQEVIEEDKELEQMANAVLGASDDKKCTYPQGYVNRQALYACASCDTTGPAGVCLACSLTCHKDHELYELYTKRNFCCDCGNSQFPEMRCRLEPNKRPKNDKNTYNHNYRGLYCICDRPFPDSEDDSDEDDEMVQCIVCEDWFHYKHLTKPPPDDYDEMVCEECMYKHKFLHQYCISIGGKRAIGKQKRREGCNLSIGVGEGSAGPAYFGVGWRKSLCQCTECKGEYVKRQLIFLLDGSDTLAAYEEKGKPNSVVTEEAGFQAMFEQLNRVQQVEMIQHYKNLKTDLTSFFKEFADKGKVIEKKDIEVFFEQQAAKKPKLDEGLPPTSCH